MANVKFCSTNENLGKCYSVLRSVSCHVLSRLQRIRHDGQNKRQFDGKFLFNHQREAGLLFCNNHAFSDAKVLWRFVYICQTESLFCFVLGRDLHDEM